ncbi:hypothetical protein DFP72DRAFT_769915, partial [Ephemerocybe angulata]
CLHFDPNSKPCLALHRLSKKLDQFFAQLDDLLIKEDWKGTVKLLTGAGAKNELWKRWEEALAEHTKPEQLLPLVPESLLAGHVQSKKKAMPPVPLPDAAKTSPKRQPSQKRIAELLIRRRSFQSTISTEDQTFFKFRNGFAFEHFARAARAVQILHALGRHLTLLLSLHGCMEDVNGLVGKADSLLWSSSNNDGVWDEAVRLYEKAFEAGGQSDRAVNQKLGKAQRKVKISKQKDYYKIVGMSRDADAKMI